jgi:hypothetical protein
MTDQNKQLDEKARGLTQSERATYQSLRARGYAHEDAYEDALDGVQVDDVRHGFPPGQTP